MCCLPADFPATSLFALLFVTPLLSGIISQKNTMLSPYPPSDLDEELVAATLQAFNLDDETISGIVRNIRLQRGDEPSQAAVDSKTRAADYIMRSAVASSSSHSGAASSVEIAHDNATDSSDRSSGPRHVAAALPEGHESHSLVHSHNTTHSTHTTTRVGVATTSADVDRSSLQKSVDSLCSRLASIEEPYDRRNYSLHAAQTVSSSVAADPYASASFQFLQSDHERDVDARGRAIVFPEDSQNRIASQYVTHKDWCPALQSHSKRTIAIDEEAVHRSHQSSVPQYYDPANVQRWIHKEFPSRISREERTALLMRGHQHVDVIFGDEVFRIKGDANPTARPSSLSHRRVDSSHTSAHRIIGGYKMAPAHKEAIQRRSSSLACSHQCPSSLPRSYHTDKVSKLNQYRRGWDNDAALKGVLGKRDATSWEIRTQLDDYRRNTW